MAVLSGPRYPISLFTWDKQSRLLVTEASMLRQGMGLVYDDAADQGITIVGKKQEITFAVERADFRACELVGWHLAPITKGAPNVRVVVIND